eukprot:TRINITY_DN1649_c0_g1_i3.p1 TRINITY_DN1649_c0_g1~~TRINITY_DN1649_c0_g1_i3.p1  ORF type:complete len:334 (+),score=136.57 TRINITY_DN1649_c0_g1_i3:76-1077(+)
MPGVGDVVQAYVEETNDWVYAKIRSENEDGTFDVKLETGTKLKGLSPDCVAAVEGAEDATPKKEKKEKKKKKEKEAEAEEEQEPEQVEAESPSKKEKKEKKKKKELLEDEDEDVPAPAKTSPKVGNTGGFKKPGSPTGARAGLPDNYVRPAGGKEVKVGRWSSYEKLGMCFDAGTMSLAEVSDDSPAKRCRLEEFVGWQLTHVNGVPCKNTLEVRNEVGDKCNLLCTFVPLQGEEKAEFDRRLQERREIEERAKLPPSPVEKSKWKKDSDVAVCEGCQDKFSMINRRHHCRQCGGIFCGKCTNKTRTVGGDENQRVCTKCDAMLQKYDNMDKK